jgi:hypothetical protein
MLSEEEARDQIRAWVLSKAKLDEPDELTDQTPLFSTRHLTSLHVPELLLLLERLRREPIDPADLGPGDFRDIATIARRFCSPAARKG